MDWEKLGIKLSCDSGQCGDDFLSGLTKIMEILIRFTGSHVVHKPTTRSKPDNKRNR
jgi:hypothetical protein